MHGDRIVVVIHTESKRESAFIREELDFRNRS